MHHYLEQCARALKEALAGVPAAEADRSRGDKWSVAQVVEHLDLTYTKNAAGLVRRLEKGLAPRRPRTRWQIVARFVVVTLGHFPTGRRAPETVMPTGRLFADVTPGLERHLIELDETLSAAERAFGAGVPVLDHPVIGPFSVSDWRRFHWVHTRHHMRQVRSLKFDVRS